LCYRGVKLSVLGEKGEKIDNFSIYHQDCVHLTSPGDDYILLPYIKPADKDRYTNEVIITVGNYSELAYLEYYPEDIDLTCSMVYNPIAHIPKTTNMVAIRTSLHISDNQVPLEEAIEKIVANITYTDNVKNTSKENDIPVDFCSGQDSIIRLKIPNKTISSKIQLTYHLKTGDKIVRSKNILIQTPAKSHKE
jgi:hypothetical protein